jgi:putative endonuclease
MVKRERQLKEWNRNWKIKIIVEKNPNWNDLYPEYLIANGYAPE